MKLLLFTSEVGVEKRAFFFENFVIDSSGSTSAVFPTTKQTLAERVLQYPDSTVYGILNFGSEVQTELTLTDAQTPTSVSNLLSNLDIIGGGTHIRTSLQRAWDDVWQPYLGATVSNSGVVTVSNPRTDQEKFLVLITDGQPTTGQSPCNDDGTVREQKVTYMKEAGVKLIALSYGDASSLSCLDEAVVFNTVEELTYLIQELQSEFGSCAVQQVYTPYNGGYSYRGASADGQKMYQHGSGYLAYYHGSDNVWMFTDPAQVQLAAVGLDEYSGNEPSRPQTGMTFRFTSNGVSQDVTILACCSDTEAPTIQPTVLTTASPTLERVLNPVIDYNNQYCDNIRVGSCYCTLEESQLDVVYVLDSSSSMSDEQWTTFTAEIANLVDGLFSEDINVGVVNFASTPETALRLNANTDHAAHANVIRNLQKIEGGTWTRRAVAAAGELFNADYTKNSDKYIVLVTGQVPTHGQEPCVNGVPSDTMQAILDSGITILPFVVSDAAVTHLSCLNDQVYSYSSWEYNGQIVADSYFYLSGDCMHSVYSPLNGDYSYGGVMSNGQKVFTSANGNSINFNTFLNTWVIEDAAKTVFMAELFSDYVARPMNGSDWSYTVVASQIQAPINDLPICCETTPSPTGVPTSAPTDNPTGYIPYDDRPPACSSFRVGCGLPEYAPIEQDGLAGLFVQTYDSTGAKMFLHEDGEIAITQQVASSVSKIVVGYPEFTYTWGYSTVGASPVNLNIEEVNPGATGAGASSLLMNLDTSVATELPICCEVGGRFYQYLYLIGSPSTVSESLYSSIVCDLGYITQWAFAQDVTHFGAMRYASSSVLDYSFSNTQTPEVVRNVLCGLEPFESDGGNKVIDALNDAYSKVWFSSKRTDNFKVTYVTVMGLPDPTQRPCEMDSSTGLSVKSRYYPTEYDEDNIEIRVIIISSDSATIVPYFGCLPLVVIDIDRPDIIDDIIDDRKTQIPTKAPTDAGPGIIIDPIPQTNDCTTFVVGECPCALADMDLDLVYVLDSSSSMTDDEWTAFTDQIAYTLENVYTEEHDVNVAVLNYASNVDVITTFDDNLTDTEKANAVSGIPKKNGGTWTRRALETTWKNVFNSNPDEARNKYIALVTDAYPTYGQEVCINGVAHPNIQPMLDANVRFLVVTTDNFDSSTVDCLSPLIINEGNTWTEQLDQLPYLYLTIGCVTTMDSPFNGGYRWEGEMENGEKVYTNGISFTAVFNDEVWEFVDSTSVINPMLERIPSNVARPPNGTDWAYQLVPGVTQNIEGLLICCTDTPAPTRQPTKEPTPAPKAPTVFVSNAPTVGQIPFVNPGNPNCLNFLVGSCPCSLDTYNLDIIYVLDSSGTITDDEWAAFTSGIANQIEDGFPDNARIGVINYASTPEVVSDLSFTTSNADEAALIRNLQKKDGGTWTRRALETAWNMFQEDIDSYPALVDSRTRYIVLVTDNRPVDTQEACRNGVPVSTLQAALDFGIAFIVAGVGDDVVWETVDCLGLELEYDNWTENQKLVSDIFYGIGDDCGRNAYSPYNGGYSYRGLMRNGYNVYEHSLNWQAYWSGEGWIFSDPADVLGVMVEISTESTYRPPNGTNWVYSDIDTGVEEHYLEHYICCVDSQTPTLNPTFHPSTKPTQHPHSSAPTVKPSNNPTFSSPTDQPTRKPSTLPSFTPTLFPLTTSPTGHPTLSPSPSPTDSPSPSPTPSPTLSPSPSPTLSPSPSPTDSPTLSPSPEPTPSPTDSPSFSPSPSPTGSPSLSPTPSPTDEPTIRPTPPPSLDPTPAPSLPPSSCDQYIDFLAEECEEDQRPLREAYDVQKARYDAIAADEQTCNEERVAVAPVIELLTDYAVDQWQNATDAGLDCKYVPTVVCETNRIVNCRMVDGVCTYYSPSHAPTVSPSVAPTLCEETPEYWEDAVNNGPLLCRFVPYEVCAGLTRCEINSFDECQNNEQTLELLEVTNVDVNGLDLLYEITNPVATGSGYYYVTEAGNPVPTAREMYISSRRRLQHACTGKIPQTNTQEVLSATIACPMSGGSSYVVYLASDVDSNAGQLSMLGEVEFELQ